MTINKTEIRIEGDDTPQEETWLYSYENIHTIAEKLVSVQPLSSPSGLIFYLKDRYSKNKQNTTNND